MPVQVGHRLGIWRLAGIVDAAGLGPGGMKAVPVALPVMFTVSMAVGPKELAKRGVLVTRLSAAEDAATMDVLCVDKTGTITMNQLALPIHSFVAVTPLRAMPALPNIDYDVSNANPFNQAPTHKAGTRFAELIYPGPLTVYV